MEKRTYNRVPSTVPVSFMYGSTIYTGVVGNISKSGMYITTEIFLPEKAHHEVLEIRIPVKGDLLEVPVRVVRLARTEGYVTAMGVKLVNPSTLILDSSPV